MLQSAWSAREDELIADKSSLLDQLTGQTQLYQQAQEGLDDLTHQVWLAFCPYSRQYGA